MCVCGGGAGGQVEDLELYLLRRPTAERGGWRKRTREERGRGEGDRADEGLGQK